MCKIKFRPNGAPFQQWMVVTSVIEDVVVRRRKKSSNVRVINQAFVSNTARQDTRGRGRGLAGK